MPRKPRNTEDGQGSHFRSLDSFCLQSKRACRRWLASSGSSHSLSGFVSCRSGSQRSAVLALLGAALCVGAAAQQPLGTVKTQGSEITGLVRVSDGSAVIGNSASVAAGIRPAEVALTRGGSVVVCAGSATHLAQTVTAGATPPLMVALDRGAMEIRTQGGKADSILTPDLRMELSDAAPLDVRVRVVANGDTCVENAGKDAPILHVTETFGDAAYFLRPGQRVLFEHGSLHEVVDHESSSCGCPRTPDTVLAGKGSLGDGRIPEAARAHPFPEAVSQGLQQPDPAQPSPVGETHTRVNSTLHYDGNTNTVTGPPGQTTSAADVAQPATAPTPPATDVHVASTRPPDEGPHPFRAIGRFFRKLFGVHD